MLLRTNVARRLPFIPKRRDCYAVKLSHQELAICISTCIAIASMAAAGSSREKRVLINTAEDNADGNHTTPMVNELNGFVVMNAGVPGNKVRFPRRVTELWGSLIDQYVWLITVDGRNWILDVERRNNNIWISSTLDRFRGEYRISGLDLLYFKHLEGNKFKVMMFSVGGLQYGLEREQRTKVPVSFIKKIVKKDYARQIVLPDEFSMKYRMHLANPITLVSAGGPKFVVRWCVRDGSIWFREGWTDFVVHNNLKKNDFLIFRLCADGGIKVDVVRDDAGMVGTTATVGRNDPLDLDLKVRELWTEVISTASVKRGLALYVPAGVVRDFLERDMDYVSVLLPSGEIEQWELNWSPGRNGECHIGSGWYGFRDRTCIAPGDVVKFSSRGTEKLMRVELL